MTLTGTTAVAQGPGEGAEAGGRRATGMIVQGNHPVALLDDDLGWTPGVVPLSVCAGARCAPVESHESCHAPQCPGSGNLLHLGHAIGDVSGWPTGVRSFEEETAALAADPYFAEISYALQPHPDQNDDGDDEEGIFLHTGLVGTAGTLGTGGGALVGGTASLGLLFAIRGEDFYDNEKFHETFFLGDRMRLMVRGMFLGALAPQGSGFIGSLGLAFEAENRIEGTAWAVPTFASLLLPELGATFREGASPGFYARFAMPFRLHVTKAAGIEVRFSAAAIERVDDQGVEALLTLSVGGFHR